jgi:hypothetical protein
VRLRLQVPHLKEIQMTWLGNLSNTPICFSYHILVYYKCYSLRLQPEVYKKAS